LRAISRLGSLSGHADRACLWSGAAILFLVYRLTLLPGVGYTGDTAKFQFLGKVLGTPHATGYPTYLLLNHFFVTAIPWGSLAFKANLLSAVCSVLACGVVYLILRRLGIQPWLSLISMLVLGLSPAFWSQSLVAEVYSLNALFIALVVHQLLAWSQEAGRRRLWAAILIYAISLGNHMTMILLFPAFAFFVLSTEPRIIRDRGTVIWAVGSLLLGAGQYGYLVWRYHDPSTLFMEVCAPGPEQLWTIVTGAQFKPVMFGMPFSHVITERVPMVAGFLWRELGILLVFAVLGVVVLRQRSILVFLLPAMAGNLLFTLNYDIPDIEVYIIPAVMFAVFSVAVGLQFIWSRLGSRTALVTAPLLLGLPLFSLLSGFQIVGQQDNTADARRIEALLDYVESDALLIGLGYHDSYYVAYYLIGEQWQESRRIYLSRHYRRDEVLEYFRHGIPITLDDQRFNAPTGLTVYVQSRTIMEQLQQDGLTATPVSHDLWRLDGFAMSPVDAPVAE